MGLMSFYKNSKRHEISPSVSLSVFVCAYVYVHQGKVT